MPDSDAQIEDMDPSNMSELDDSATDAKNASVADAAASSPATGENEQENELLSVVRDVVKDRNPGAQAASPTAGSEEDGQDKADQKKPDDENYSDVPFHKHPRFQHLLRERNTFKQDAGRYHNVVDFLDNAGLSSEEAADGLEILGLAKTNPAEAFERMRPWLEKLVVAAGRVLSPELQQRVEKGELTQQAALEISQATARAQSLEASQSFRQQQAQRRQQTEQVTALQTTAHEWEQDRLAKDPNFVAKQPAIMKEVLFLQRTEGVPSTPDAVREQLKKAYKAVNDSFRPPQPVAQQRQPVRPVTGGQVAGNQRPAPNGKEMSTLDIVRANRRTG